MNKEIQKSEKILTDYTISLGCACRPAHYLRTHGLRRCSNPLDWMMLYSLDNVLELFKNDFSNFFKTKSEHADKAVGKFRYVEDLQNGMISMHSFPLDVDIDVAYESFLKTMKHRFERMKKCMRESEHVLFVSNRDESVEEFKKFLLEMHKLFPCKLTYLNIRYAIEYKMEKFEINPELEIVEYHFNDEHIKGWNPESPDFWKGNEQEWDKVMQSIELSEKFASLNLVQIEDRVQK